MIRRRNTTKNVEEYENREYENKEGRVMKGGRKKKKKKKKSCFTTYCKLHGLRSFF
jgi:hypothetical protein